MISDCFHLLNLTMNSTVLLLPTSLARGDECCCVPGVEIDDLLAIKASSKLVNILTVNIFPFVPRNKRPIANTREANKRKLY